MREKAVQTVRPASDAMWEMALIHRIFRRGFRDIDRWIGQVPPEGASRAEAVATHLRRMIGALHGHHTTEDELVWPLLRERGFAAEVDAMEGQHERIDAAAEEVERLLPLWSRQPTGETAAALRASLTGYRRLVITHLDEEERTVVPLIAAHLSVGESAAAGEEGFKKLPADYRFIALGQMLEAAGPEEAERMMGGLPAPARAAWRLIGRRRFQRTMGRLRGKRSPALMAVMRTASKYGVASYRRSGGRRSARVKGLPVLVLKVVGRRSGREHSVTVAYFRRGAAFLIAGSGGGSEREPQWFTNLRAADTAEITVGPDTMRARVQVPDREERDRLWSEVVSEAPFFAKYQRKAQRLIPLALLTPLSPGPSGGADDR